MAPSVCVYGAIYNVRACIAYMLISCSNLRLYLRSECVVAVTQLTMQNSKIITIIYNTINSHVELVCVSHSLLKGGK